MDFALIGAAGYVAPRHMKAIRESGGTLVAAFDPADSVGVIDEYFPDAWFFSEFERFDRHVNRIRREGQAISYLTVCSPNYFHDAHVRFGLRAGADVICEKPLVLNPWNLDSLAEVSEETGCTVSSILQLRIHPGIVKLRQMLDAEDMDTKHDVDLTYIAPRGRWYDVSWKGDTSKSGGIATNIGIHFFDALIYLFGPVQQSVVHLAEARRSAGYLELGNARVRWFLSAEREDLQMTGTKDAATYRSMTLDGQEIDFSSGFQDLHTQSYRQIIAGKGFSIEDVRPSIVLASQIRTEPPTAGKGERHALAQKKIQAAG